MKKDGEEKNVTEEAYEQALKETPDTQIQESENRWEVTVENPYGDAPHVMEFKLNGEAREVTFMRFE